MSNNILKSLIGELVESYLEESYEDDLIESIFEEVSEETWEAIQEAILNELSPATLNRYINKSTRDQDKRTQLAKDADNRIADRKIHNPFSTKDKARRDKTDQQSSDRNWRKAYNREVGQERAASRLAKESIQESANLDKISKELENTLKKMIRNGKHTSTTSYGNTIQIEFDLGDETVFEFEFKNDKFVKVTVFDPEQDMKYYGGSEKVNLKTDSAGIRSAANVAFNLK